MNQLAGKTALITGASSGIGLATSRLFSKEGARVAITGRDEAALETARACLGEGSLAIRSDASDLTDINAMVERLSRRFQRLDIVVVNAGIALPAPFEGVDEAQFDAMANVNFKGVFFTIQKLLPLMGTGGSIVVTTSITNQMGSPNFSVYAACKAALRSLVQSLGLELIAKGIRVNAVSPGPISTAMWGRMGLPEAVEQDIKAEIEKKSPIQRFGLAEEVARAALFLASDDSSYVVGDELVVDGGMSLL